MCVCVSCTECRIKPQHKDSNNSFKRENSSNIWGTALTHQNCIHGDMRGRLKSGNGRYHSVQILLSSSLLSKHIKIKIHRTIILPVFWYGCETWSLTLGKERRLRVFENRVLRKIFGPKRKM